MTNICNLILIFMKITGYEHTTRNCTDFHGHYGAYAKTLLNAIFPQGIP